MLSVPSPCPLATFLLVPSLFPTLPHDCIAWKLAFLGYKRFPPRLETNLRLSSSAFHESFVTPATARLYRVEISHSWIQNILLPDYKIYNFCSFLFIFYHSLDYLPHDTIVRQQRDTIVRQRGLDAFIGKRKLKDALSSVLHDIK